jgi:hypothetical protein
MIASTVTDEYSDVIPSRNINLVRKALFESGQIFGSLKLK